MILDICDNSNILKIISYAKIVINVIKIVVPIILIISLSIEYMNAVRKDDQDLLAKANKNAIRKMIAAVAVFMIPTLVGITLRLSNPKPDTPIACLRDATSSNIKAAAVNEARDLLVQARDNLSSTDLQAARNAIDNIPSSESEKQSLENEATRISNYITLHEAINSLKFKDDPDLYKQLETNINKLSDNEMKDRLSKELSEAGKGTTLNEQSGTHKGTSGNLTYYVHVPNNPKTNLPLVLYLHGDGGESMANNSYFYQQVQKYFGKDYPFILVEPAGGMWAETSGRLAEIKNIVDSTCDKYKCNKSKISISGASRGSIGTWHMINNYPTLFYAAVPISCGSYSINAQNFTHTKIRAFAGDVGSNEQRYNSEMRAIVSSIQRAGGTASFTTLSGQSHTTVLFAAVTQDTLLFLIQ